MMLRAILFTTQAIEHELIDNKAHSNDTQKQYSLETTQQEKLEREKALCAVPQKMTHIHTPDWLYNLTMALVIAPVKRIVFLLQHRIWLAVALLIMY
jgi:hypothetical protein